MITQAQERSFATAQCTVEESTYQVVKEIVFDDEYEPFEEVEPHYEEKEPFKIVLGQTLGLDSQVESKEHFEGCLEEFLFQEKVHESLDSSSSYILYELEPTKKFLYQLHHSRISLVDFMCRTFSYQVMPKDCHDQDHMW